MESRRVRKAKRAHRPSSVPDVVGTLRFAHPTLYRRSTAMVRFANESRSAITDTK
jgi:hypothetical protein